MFPFEVAFEKRYVLMIFSEEKHVKTPEKYRTDNRFIEVDLAYVFVQNTVKLQLTLL